MRNCYYRRGSQALQRAKGRELFGVVGIAASPLSDIEGIRDFQFDNGNHFILGMSVIVGAGRFRWAPVGTQSIGSFTDVGTVATALAGVQGLDMAHYRNRFYVFNGAAAADGELNTNFVIYGSATSIAETPRGRQHGMLPVTQLPKITTTTGTFSQQTVTGYYDYWTTEVAKIRTDDADLLLESAFGGNNGQTVFVNASSVVPIIPRPTFRNSIGNRWRVYRSPKKEKQLDPGFPIGFMIADLPITTASHNDTALTATAGQFLPVSVNSGTNKFADWANPTNLTASGGGFATMANAAQFINGRQGVYGFPFSAIAGHIVGIEVELAGFVSAGTAPCPITVRLGPNRGANGAFVGQVIQFEKSSSGARVTGGYFASKHGLISATASGALTTLTLGGPTDRWFNSTEIGITDADLNSGTVMAVLEHSTVNTTMAVDYVKMKIYYSGSSDTAVVFPSVVYSFGDVTSQVAKNHPPPSATTGVVFQDSLVTNDVSNPSLLKYSYPGDPEAFPPTYYIDFETERNDVVTAIKVVNNRLVVGLNSSVWRVNYLPSERDASFDRGKAIESISTTFGCLKPSCATVFSPGGGSELMAFVSDHGVHVTDGDSFDTLTDNLDWRQIISAEATSYPICLINDRENHDLVLYYRNDSGVSGADQDTYFKLHFNYGKEHRLEDGSYKVSGPVHMRNYDGSNYAAPRSAWAIRQNGGNTVMFTGYGESPTSSQFVRATADLAVGNWKQSVASGSPNIYTMIDESEALGAVLDTDYIFVIDASAAATAYEAGMTQIAAGSVPNAVTGHFLSIRVRKTASILISDVVTVTMRIDAGADFFTRSITPLNSSFTTYRWELTVAERLAITDYTMIKLKFSVASSSSSGQQFQVSWAQLEVPGRGATGPGAGAIYMETGQSIPSADPAMSFSTRRMYLSGLGGEWKLQELYGYMSSQRGHPVLSYTARSTVTNSPGEVAVEAPDFTLSGEVMHKVHFQQAGEGIAIEMNTIADHNDAAFEYLMIEGEDFGDESQVG